MSDRYRNLLLGNGCSPSANDSLSCQPAKAILLASINRILRKLHTYLRNHKPDKLAFFLSGQGAEPLQVPFIQCCGCYVCYKLLEVIALLQLAIFAVKQWKQDQEGYSTSLNKLSLNNYLLSCVNTLFSSFNFQASNRYQGQAQTTFCQPKTRKTGAFRVLEFCVRTETCCFRSLC